jgi:hypothetical protein
MAVLPIQNGINAICRAERSPFIFSLDDPVNQTFRREIMKRYVIERALPGVGQMAQDELKGAATTSNAALSQLAGKAQWVQSFVADDKTFCIYLAENEEAVEEHARISGFPATEITEVRTVIDPMTAQA